MLLYARLDDIALTVPPDKYTLRLRRYLRLCRTANVVWLDETSVAAELSFLRHMLRFAYTCNDTRVGHIAPGRHYRKDFNNKNRFSKQHLSCDA